MDDSVFKAFCAGIDRLSVAQMRVLGQMLRNLGARTEVLAKIDARSDGIDFCLYRGNTVIRRWGRTRTGLQRFRCLTCLRSFSSATDTLLARMRRPEKFHQVVEDMLAAAPSSCRALAEKLQLDKMTVWRWRKRIIEVLTGVGASAFGGIVEADEKFFRESRKGSREWVNYFRQPDIFPEPPRPRWEDYKREKKPLPAGTSQWQIPVLTITGRSGERRADVVPSRYGPVMMAMLAKHVGKDAVLCSDGDTAYASFAQQHGIPHYRLNASEGVRVIDQAFHIQTINNLHNRFEAFMAPFCGPATKNLPGYAAWFITKLMSGDAPQRETWSRLLAI